jgi:hypothetical protein
LKKDYEACYKVAELIIKAWNNKTQ